MKTYNVEFWYSTDMRASFTVDALSTAQAIYAAEVKGAKLSSIRDWCDNGPEFHVKVELGTGARECTTTPLTR